MSSAPTQHPLAPAYQRLRELRAQGDSWVFVLHNPENNGIPSLFKDVEMCFWQLEQGSKAGARVHLQGVVKFLYPKSFSQVRRMLPTAWWHKMLGTPEQAVAYCCKSETRVSGPWAVIPISTNYTRAWESLDSTQRALQRPFDQEPAGSQTPDAQSEPRSPKGDVTA